MALQNNRPRCFARPCIKSPQEANFDFHKTLEILSQVENGELFKKFEGKQKEQKWQDLVVEMGV